MAMPESMPLAAIVAGRVFTGERMLADHAVLIRGDRIEAVVPRRGVPKEYARREAGEGLLAPGFIDVQVNGGGGVLFNDDPSVETIQRMGAAHRRFGTTGFLPTLITDSSDAMGRAIAAVRQGMADGVPGLLGIHLEGPFLDRGRRGVHRADVIRAATAADIATSTSLGCGRTLVTLAPEHAPPGFIEALVEADVLVAAGHTDASYDQAVEGLRRGVRGFTHLFNAMSPLTHRQPGAVGAALADPESWCGLIVDGHHVHPATLKIAIAAKPRGKMMLVTDAMSLTGTEARSFVLQGQHIGMADGRLTTADGILAGSALDMATAVRNTVRLLELPVAEALRMASSYPAAFLGLEREYGRIAPGFRADLVCLDADLRVRSTWIGGS
jgi:N-acetylglucosamine-6-phosphate deacetylase